MSLSAWAFDDPTAHTTSDGKHTFYRVQGHSQRTTRVGGMDIRVGAHYGVGTADVTGEGPTQELALHDAMRRAIQADDEANQVMARFHVTRMGNI